MSQKENFVLSLSPVCVCVSARADRGHSSTCCPPPQPSLRAAVLLKQIGASRLCHRTTGGPSHRVSGGDTKANKTDKGEIKAGETGTDLARGKREESVSRRRDGKREMLQKERKW